MIICSNFKAQFPFGDECRNYIKVTDVIEHVRRSTHKMTNLNTAHKRKGRSSLYHIAEKGFATAGGKTSDTIKMYYVFSVYYKEIKKLCTPKIILVDVVLFDFNLLLCL